MTRRFFPRSMGGQLLVMLLVALVISQGLSLVIFSDERDRAVRAALAFEAAGRAANVVQLLESAPTDLHAEIIAAASSPLVRFWISPKPAVDHTYHDDAGVADRLRRALSDPARDVRLEVHDRTANLPGIDDVPISMQQMHASMLAERTGPLELAMSVQLSSGTWLNISSMFHRPVGQWLSSDILALAIAAALITVVAIITAVRVVKPMRSLARAAEHAGRGEIRSDVPESGPQEVRDTIRAFNSMQDRLSRFLSDRTRMLAALSHDLRSPLTAMRLRLEFIEAGEDRDRLMAMVDEMQMMAEATLAFARGEAEAEKSAEIDLADMLRDLAAETDEDERVTFKDNAPTTLAKVRPVAFKRALRNLIDNAIRYGDRAEIGLLRQDDEAIITISDQGSGLPEDQLETVFEPFQRIETSRNRDTGGAGLGLAIARSVIRAHGGDITLTNRSGGGLAATVRLPL